MTQTEWIFTALKRGPITPIEALDGCGCFRLGARIHELRQAGHQIATEFLTLNNGKTIGSYHLATTKGDTAA